MKFKVGDKVIIKETSRGIVTKLSPGSFDPFIEVKVTEGPYRSGGYYDSSLDVDDGRNLQIPVKTEPVAGLNKDDGKLRVDLVPVSAIRSIAEVLGGACASGKYPARNWEKGISYSRIYANILRHLMAWYDGEDKDKESGLHPLKHALCRLSMLVEYIEKGKVEFDDRPGKK